MADLQALDQQHPAGVVPKGLPRSITTPLKLESWDPHLASHPDQEFGRCLITGIREGFRIGCTRDSLVLSQRLRNFPSVRQHPAIVAQYIDTERQAGHLDSPIAPELQGHCQISSIGIIPKPHQPGKWRLIVDLSAPWGRSINDGIDPVVCSMKYASVDQAVGIVQSVGQGALLSKLDLKSAYTCRMVPVHPDD